MSQVVFQYLRPRRWLIYEIGLNYTAPGHEAPEHCSPLFDRSTPFAVLIGKEPHRSLKRWVHVRIELYRLLTIREPHQVPTASYFPSGQILCDDRHCAE
ncbi:MAG: hypothetical protein HXY20_06200 [Acidobacteria bacterium]|nr:hypothetical protein [Acidobacteriota bacterium]